MVRHARARQSGESRVPCVAARKAMCLLDQQAVRAHVRPPEVVPGSTSFAVCSFAASSALAERQSDETPQVSDHNDTSAHVVATIGNCAALSPQTNSGIARADGIVEKGGQGADLSDEASPEHRVPYPDHFFHEGSLLDRKRAHGERAACGQRMGGGALLNRRAEGRERVGGRGGGGVGWEEGGETERTCEHMALGRRPFRPRQDASALSHDADEDEQPPVDKLRGSHGMCRLAEVTQLGGSGT